MQADLDISPQLPVLRAQLAKLGLRWLGNLSYNQTAAELYQLALQKGEGKASATGTLVVETGEHTGRSPKDKFVVCDDTTASSVWWDNNQAMSSRHFENLRVDMMVHARSMDLCVQDLEACADPVQSLPVRVITELTWQGLFIRHLLKPALDFSSGLTILNLPSFKANPERHGTNSQTVIAFDLTNNLVLIAGTQYGGEIKKAVFTVLNYKLPASGVLPMHCSANVGKTGDTAVFFGLSGTGKTTLSADPTRTLIGDDEHGWNDSGVFNIENGCYAKVISLSAEAEPEIHKASLSYTTVLENVVMEKNSGEVHFDDKSLTENTRAAYPLSLIANSSKTRQAPPPKTIIMLTADAFGVLPPIACLTPDQAMQQFLAGYTAKLAGTELGVKSPQATFSACFGAPFLPRHPVEYGQLLKVKLAQSDTRCFLINTGWTGGAFGVGTRISLAATRKILTAALSGQLDHMPTRTDEIFGFAVPLHIEGIDDQLLDPKKNWSDPAAYDQSAKNLKQLFDRALEKFRPITSKVMAAE